MSATLTTAREPEAEVVELKYRPCDEQRAIEALTSVVLDLESKALTELSEAECFALHAILAALRGPHFRDKQPYFQKITAQAEKLRVGLRVKPLRPHHLFLMTFWRYGEAFEVHSVGFHLPEPFAAAAVITRHRPPDPNRRQRRG